MAGVDDSGPYRRGERGSARHSRRCAGCARLACPGPRLVLRPGPDPRAPAASVPAANVTAIDVHTHLGRWLTNDTSWMAPDVDALLRVMEECNLTALVNLDGRWGRELEANLDRYDRAHPERFYTFCHLDWGLLRNDARTERHRAARRVARAVGRERRRGAQGLEGPRSPGRCAGERRISTDDPALAPVWEAAGALGLPVMVHTGDPLAFFQPADRFNERIEELRRHPSISLAQKGRRSPGGCAMRSRPPSRPTRRPRSSAPTSPGAPRTSRGSTACSSRYPNLVDRHLGPGARSSGANPAPRPG